MPSLTPLLSAPLPIAPHALVAFAALAIGGIQLASRKGTKRHRWLGYVWCVMMFFCGDIGFLYPFDQIMGAVQPDQFAIGIDDCLIGTGNLVRPYRPHPPASTYHGKFILAGAGGNRGVYLFPRADYVCRCQRIVTD